MTGFKEGASPSGFDDIDDESDADVGESAPDRDEVDTNSEPSDAATDSARVPWLYRRANARDGRPKTKQLHLQESTARQESQFKSDAEAAVDERVKLTDLREAALLVAMDHVDEVADQLREWGYDQT